MVYEDSYRVVVATIILNKEKKVMMCEHVWIDDAWQFPQGEIEEGEKPEETVMRELKEELGSDKFVILDKIDKPIKYHFPHYLKNKYQMNGNTQHFFLLYYHGDESEIRFDCQKRPEFKAIKWVDYDEPPREVIYFKKLSYLEALNKFKEKVENLDINNIKFSKN